MLNALVFGVVFLILTSLIIGATLPYNSKLGKHREFFFLASFVISIMGLYLGVLAIFIYSIHELL